MVHTSCTYSYVRYHGLQIGNPLSPGTETAQGIVLYVLLLSSSVDLTISDAILLVKPDKMISEGSLNNPQITPHL